MCEAKLTMEDLWRSSRQAVKNLEATKGGSNDADLDRAVWQITLDEAERGWLEGPFSADDLDGLVGMWVPSRGSA